VVRGKNIVSAKEIKQIKAKAGADITVKINQPDSHGLFH